MLNDSYYIELEQNFEKIKLIYSEESLNKNKLNAAIGNIRFLRKQIVKSCSKHEKDLLMYCIDTLFEIIEENNPEKTYDFANTIYEIPEIFLRTRNIYSFRKGFVEFRNKYGEKYFPNYNKVYPHFTHKTPLNWRGFFLTESDDDFKTLHPIGYYFLLALGIVALFTPLAIMIVYAIIFDPRNSGWIFLCYLGTFVMGIGLFNLVAAIIHQYLGHTLTVVCLFGGAFVTFSAWCLTYNEKLYAMFNQERVAFVFLTLLFVSSPIISFIIFRRDISDRILREKSIKKSEIKVMMKGFLNYWLYRKLHKTYDLGRVYILNKVYVSMLAITLVTSPFAMINKNAGVVLCISSAMLQLFSCYAYYFFNKKKSGNSSDLQFLLVPIILSAVHLYCITQIP